MTSPKQPCWAWAIALSVSCAPASVTPPLPSPVTTSIAPESTHSAATPTPAPESTNEASLQKKLSATLAYVSQIRSLSTKAEVRGRLISRDEIERFLSKELDEQTPKDVLEANRAILFGLGTVSAGFDYRDSILKLMTSQLLGFYDPKQKTFFVEGKLVGEEADATLFHELVHALQDQHYDLTHLGDFEEDGGDRQSAVHGLAEGDATSAMLDAMLKPNGGSALDVPDTLLQAQTLLGGAALDSAPRVLVRSLLAPYIDGLTFTNELRRSGGFAAVDAAWRSPPQSTEQLLHVSKFRAREAPLDVPLPPPPGHAPELAQRFHDVMGEQTLRIFLEEWLPARTAAAAAADWGGDRLSAFADEKRELWAIGWHLRFDNAAAAERAFIAFARSAPLMEAGMSGAQPDTAEVAARSRDKLCRKRRTAGTLALVRRGVDVAVTIGPFRPTAETVAADPDCKAALAWAKLIVSN
jgi:hypothetical protein